MTTAVTGLGKHSSDKLPQNGARQSDSSSDNASADTGQSPATSAKNDDPSQFVVAPGATVSHQTEVMSTSAASANTSPSVDPQSVVAQTALGVADSFSNHQEVRIKLSPPELGELQIDVAQQNGVLTARLESQSSATHHLLLDNLPNLKDTLAQQGINLQRIDVVLNEDSGRQANSGSAGAFQQSGGQQDRTPQPYVPPVPQLAPADPVSGAGTQSTIVASSSPSTGPLKQLDIKV